MNNAVIRAAGAVVWRPGPDGAEILLVHRDKYDDWSLPKGKREPGEHRLVTAVREVQEETSVRPVLGPRLRKVSYLFRGEPKRVDYWSATTADEARSSHEVDAVAWLPLGQAGQRLSYSRDQEVVSGLIPRPTVPLIIVRHASARPKRGDDLGRRLDAHGARDAAALAGLLACFAPRARVLSSPARRCADTVRPYAAVAAVEVEQTPDLITDGGTTPEPLIQALVRAARPAVVCVHRENLGAVLHAACAALGAASPAKPGLPKGAFWVLHAGPAVTIERYRPLQPAAA